MWLQEVSGMSADRGKVEKLEWAGGVGKVVKIGNLLKPMNLLRLVLGCLVIGISSFNLFILNKSATVTVTNNRLNLASQLLLVVFFVTSGIMGLKDENKLKRNSSYVYFIAAIFMLILDTMTILTLVKAHRI
ncbi:hypothetical protein DEAC_c36450 [Desulfosporosinus acididurans]|uniref:Uncharacterized protein n=1 Tax=Desulfosporosinus acididurans TaxID=476652 RepID=A0A0J1FNB2_9FIRM|nr:hypothetical protein DEAC_c36450 [Desulfosporosinus acididurans]